MEKMGVWGMPVLGACLPGSWDSGTRFCSWVADRELGFRGRSLLVVRALLRYVADCARWRHLGCRPPEQSWSMDSRRKASLPLLESLVSNGVSPVSPVANRAGDGLGSRRHRHRLAGAVHGDGSRNDWQMARGERHLRREARRRSRCRD
ncbi:hypothetical protein QBC39DRAFT_438527 [Podospora conica]|nr:hypothetical protein QBC39DRAFT_438527 [Schizothecium conicum]